ncbi:MAG: DUF1176 domain-containing protein [Mesorhizobium sp.]|nr:DUF1176 domain-containing protein [Mesorhizobium sp.]
MRFATVWPLARTAGLAALASLAPLAGLSSAGAQGTAAPAYMDDRSDPSALVQSLYNAVNRKEYARAWSYFSTKPAASLDAFAAGFADTAAVAIVTGTPSEEGAAGSVFYSVPVAIRATNDAGAEQVFAGCYTLKLANPQIQGDPFTPLHIDKATLAASGKGLDEALPAQCGDGPPPPARDATLERAKAEFAASRADDCIQAPDEMAEPESFPIRFRYVSDTDAEPEREARLFRFFCSRGAYNETHVYLLANDFGELQELHFATPELDIRYAEGGEEKVESVTVKGFTTASGLVNSEYDPATHTLTSWSKWRGIGDASTVGTWIFRNGAFTLVQFDVDASYDGEIEHTTVVNYNEAP